MLIPRKSWPESRWNLSIDMSKRAKPEIWPVLIAGGRGTRFWPLSRKKRPKQLLGLVSKKPLIRRSCQILEPLAGRKNIFVSTSQELAPSIKKVLPGISASNYILEPNARDTAPAIGLALALLSRRINPQKPEPVLMFLPSDHHLKRPAEFRKVLLAAAKIAAQKDLIVTIGVKPGFPSANFGYIQPGAPLGETKTAFAVKKFIEKPALSSASRYLKKGYFWNAGIFIARPSVLWRAFAKHQPGMHKRLEKIYSAPSAGLNAVIKREFRGLKKVSFDYGIMEKAKEVAVTAGDFGWSDLGGFKALASLVKERRAGNAGKGRLIPVESQDLFVHTRKLTAALGVQNLAIVETEDALLVMDISKDALLKELVSELERLRLFKYL